MKKVAYLLTMVFVLTFAFTSCEKDDNDDVIKTLEELYPEWSYLYGEAPEVGEGVPTITITIDGNVGTIKQVLPQINQVYTLTFNKIEIVGNTVYLKVGESDVIASGTFTKSGSEILKILTLTTSGLAKAQYSATYTF